MLRSTWLQRPFRSAMQTHLPSTQQPALASALSFRHQYRAKTGGAKRSPGLLAWLTQMQRSGLRRVAARVDTSAPTCRAGKWAVGTNGKLEAWGCAVGLTKEGQAQGSSMLSAPRVLPTISHANHPAPPAAGPSSPPAAAECCWPPPLTPRAAGAPHSPKGLPLARPAHCPLLQLLQLLPPHSAPPLPPLPPPPLLLHLLRHLLHCRPGSAGGPPLGS